MVKLPMYPISSSPLYRLGTKRKLAEVLSTTLVEINRLTHDTARNYNVFPISNGVKERWIQEPKADLKRLHDRLFRLLQRIDTPAYLHSGVKGHSYMTNAEAHRGPQQVFKLDIKSFFPSVAWTHIYYFFHDILCCSEDVAWKLREINTIGDQLPTGSCISQVVAFYAYKPMFDRLHELSDANGVRMTCYVDDLTFSGNNITGRFKFDVKQTIARAGLRYHKERFYGHTKPKLITGVVVNGEQLQLRNKHRLSIYNTIKLYRGLPPGDERDKVLRSLVGRCCAASLIEPEYRAVAHRVSAALRPQQASAVAVG